MLTKRGVRFKKFKTGDFPRVWQPTFLLGELLFLGTPAYGDVNSLLAATARTSMPEKRKVT